jgi:hypothetical protein
MENEDVEQDDHGDRNAKQPENDTLHILGPFQAETAGADV